MADGDDLDALVRRVDPDRWLSSRFIVDAEKRADVVALYAYDHELARAEKVASNPLIAEIRLTWWREVLDEIFGRKPVRAHPAARALALAVSRRHLPRGSLETMIDARIGAFDRTPMSLARAEAWAEDVVGSATLLASRVLDPASSSDVARHAGTAWGLLMLRRSPAAEADLDAPLRIALAIATEGSRRVSAAAFPAIAAVTLAKREVDGRRPSALEARLRLLGSVLRGRI